MQSVKHNRCTKQCVSEKNENNNYVKDSCNFISDQKKIFVRESKVIFKKTMKNVLYLKNVYQIKKNFYILP